MSSLSHIATNYKVKSGPHPWNKPYSLKCIRKGCDNEPLEHEGIFYSCCDSCLKEQELGPYKKRITKTDHYSSLFWLTDIERKLQ